jgi:hypothetical protein
VRHICSALVLSLASTPSSQSNLNLLRANAPPPKRHKGVTDAVWAVRPAPPPPRHPYSSACGATTQTWLRMRSLSASRSHTVNLIVGDVHRRHTARPVRPLRVSRPARGRVAVLAATSTALQEGLLQAGRWSLQEEGTVYGEGFLVSAHRPHPNDGMFEEVSQRWLDVYPACVAAGCLSAVRWRCPKALYSQTLT